MKNIVLGTELKDIKTGFVGVAISMTTFLRRDPLVRLEGATKSQRFPAEGLEFFSDGDTLDINTTPKIVGVQ